MHSFDETSSVIMPGVNVLCAQMKATLTSHKIKYFFFFYPDLHSMQVIIIIRICKILNFMKCLYTIQPIYNYYNTLDNTRQCSHYSDVHSLPLRYMRSSDETSSGIMPGIHVIHPRARAYALRRVIVVGLSVGLSVCPYVFFQTMAVIDTKCGYVGMCNGRSAQQKE